MSTIKELVYLLNKGVITIEQIAPKYKADVQAAQIKK